MSGAGIPSRCSRARGRAIRGAGRCPVVAGRVVAAGPDTVACRVGGPHRSATVEKRKIEKIENVFSPLPKIVILSNLEAEFGKVPIGENVLLFEIYNFVNLLGLKFGVEI